MKLARRVLSSLLSVALVWTLTPMGAIAYADPAEEVLPSEEQDVLAAEDLDAGVETTEADPAELVDDDEPSPAGEVVEEETADGSDAGDMSGLAEEPDNVTEEAPEELVCEGDPEYSKPELLIAAHVQTYGWMEPVGEGEVAGTFGQSKRVEALRVILAGDNIPEGDIELRAHVQTYGWMDWVKDGDLCGTSGQSKRVEALKIRLTGEVASLYDVYYQVHAQRLGWMSVAKNGEATGSAGCSYRIEAVRIWLVPKDEAAPSPATDTAEVFHGNLGLSVQAHVQSIGWQAAVGNGGTAGTSGKSLRVEALKMSVSGLEETGSIQYQAHVQGIGWQGWKKDGEIAGTSGQSKRVEALRIELTGELASNYDIYYRAHVQSVGWLAWAKNGEVAGSEGFSKRVEAIQVSLVSKGMPTPSTSGQAYDLPCLAKSSLSYATYVHGKGWLSSVSNGATSGTTGQSLAVEGLRVSVSGDEGSVLYRACPPGASWTAWSKNGADLYNGGSRLEAIQIKLSGNISKVYDVWYRTHVQSVGWTGWCKNGASNGSSGLNFRIEALQVKLVPKNGAAPGETYRPLVTKENLYDEMTKKAQGYSSSTGYLVMIDTENCYVGIYKGSYGNWTRINYWRCSCGAPSTPTVKGVYTVFKRVDWFGHTGEYRVWYATGFYSEYYLHSVLYTDDDNQNSFVDSRLGKHISQGCIRLDIKNAKWIYQNIPYGTTIVSY